MVRSEPPTDALGARLFVVRDHLREALEQHDTLWLFLAEGSARRALEVAHSSGMSVDARGSDGGRELLQKIDAALEDRARATSHAEMGDGLLRCTSVVGLTEAKLGRPVNTLEREVVVKLDGWRGKPPNKSQLADALGGRSGYHRRTIDGLIEAGVIGEQELPDGEHLLWLLLHRSSD